MSDSIERDQPPTVVCQQYDGCRRPAKYRVTTLGGNAELDALDHLDVCESCADEWRETPNYSER